MQGYSVKLPLIFDNIEDGPYLLNKTILDTIKQNFKMVLLTNPGERMMNGDFGVGLRRFLFEQNNYETRDVIKSRIISQTNKYLSFIQINEINISDPDANQENLVFIKISYSIPALNANDELNVQI